MGIDDAGVPDPPQGEEAADDGVRLGRLGRRTTSRTAQDSLDEEADSLEESIEQLTDAARAIGTMLASGVQTIADVAQTRPRARRCVAATRARASSSERRGSR